jgi:hypothetical protein
MKRDEERREMREMRVYNKLKQTFKSQPQHHKLTPFPYLELGQFPCQHPLFMITPLPSLPPFPLLPPFPFKYTTPLEFNLKVHSISLFSLFLRRSSYHIKLEYITLHHFSYLSSSPSPLSLSHFIITLRYIGCDNSYQRE